MQYLELRNTTLGINGRPLDTPFYYPVADGLTLAQATALFTGDAAREGKLLTALPAVPAGKVRTFAAAAVTPAVTARTLFVGSAITYAASGATAGWSHSGGQSATDAAHDYVHLFTAGGPFTIAPSTPFEGNYATYDPAADSALNAGLAAPTDRVVLQLGEGVDNGSVGDGTYEARLTSLVDYIVAVLPEGALVLLLTPLSPRPAVTAIHRRVAAVTGARLADISGLWTSEGDTANAYLSFNSGLPAPLARQPSNAGHAAIAAALTASLSSTTQLGFDYLPLADTPRPASGRVALDGVGIHLELALDKGAAADVASGPGIADLMNRHDLGRLFGIGWYDKDAPYHPPGVDVYPGEFANIGYNPISPGDIYGNGSAVVAFGQQGTTTYTKVVPYHWHLRAHAAPMTMELWYRPLGDGALRCWGKITHNRTDKTTQPESQEQELPYFYTTDTSSRYVYYEGLAPWTGGPLTVRDAFEADGTHRSEGDRYSVRLGEPWVASVSPTTGLGVGLVGPDVNVLTHRALGSPAGGRGNGGSNTGYVGVMVSMVPDNITVRHFTFDMVMGSAEQIRAYAAALPRPDNRPHFVFNSGSRHGCYYQKAYDNGEAAITQWLTLTGRTGQMAFYAPDRTYAAAGISTIYLRMRVAGGRSGLRLTWRRPGLTGGEGYGLSFTVPNDGAFHTVAVPVGGHGSWAGTISGLGIEYDGIREETPVPGRVWDIAWISFNNLTT